MTTLRTTLTALGFAAAVALASSAALALPQQPEPSVIVISDVTLIDVENSRTRPHQTVTIKGERIERIEDAGQAALPAGAQVIEGKGLWLMPGLFDAHVHITASADTFGPMMLANGVVACRDTGADTQAILTLREQSKQRGSTMPQIICTGAIIDGVPPIWPFSEPCDTPEQARDAVRRLHEAGVDMIKVYSLLKPDVYRAAVEEAHVRKLKVTGHVPNSVTLAEAVEAGHNCVEHLMGFERLLIELSGKPDDGRAGVWPGFGGWLRYDAIDKTQLRERLTSIAKASMMQCPTMVVMQGIGSAADADKANADERMAYVPTSLRAFWGGDNYKAFGEIAREVIAHQQSLVGELHKAGVPLMIGSDLGNPYVFSGFAVHEEMRLFAGAGMPAMDVLRAATIIPARYCGVDSDYGSITPGKLASLVLVRGDPTADIANTSQIDSVLIRGEHHDRAGLDAMLKSVRDLVASGAPAQTEQVDMTLPGEIIARGRYVMKFNSQFEAGVEDFIITRDGEDMLIRGHSQPLGGWAPPTVITLRYDKHHRLKDASLKQLVQKPVEAKYVVKDNALHATAMINNEAQKPQSAPAPSLCIIMPSINAGDFATFGMLRDMNVNDKRELPAVIFGSNGWQMASMTCTVTRQPDESIERGGNSVNTWRFTTTMTNQGMDFEINTWLDDHGIMLRSRMRAPFGIVEATLAEDAEAKP